MTRRPREVHRGSRPAVYLAYNPGPVNAYKGIRVEDGKKKGPTARSALGAEVVKSVGPRALGSPSVRLAINGKGQGETNGALAIAPTGRLALAEGQAERDGNESLESPDSRPALLVSYYYLEPFLKNRSRYHFRDWVMDSGAFSAHNSGVEIKHQDYLDCCKLHLESDPQLSEVFALDVIGDWRAGLKNAEEAWKQGVEAIPCFHYGEPWELLRGLAKDYPKVAIGGCVGKRDKDKFAGECFARVWPKKLHGFGFGSEKSLMLYPWYSVDATNWELLPCKYGRWAAFGNASISVRGSKQNLRSEVEWYLDLERRARERWKSEMQKLQESEGLLAGRLAVQGKGDSHSRYDSIAAPTVRLVGNGDGVTQRQIEAFAPRPKPKKK